MHLQPFLEWVSVFFFFGHVAEVNYSVYLLFLFIRENRVLRYVC